MTAPRDLDEARSRLLLAILLGPAVRKVARNVTRPLVLRIVTDFLVGEGFDREEVARVLEALYPEDLEPRTGGPVGVSWPHPCAWPEGTFRENP